MATADSVVIVSACRTAVGTFQGTLSTLPAHALGEIAVREALKVWMGAAVRRQPRSKELHFGYVLGDISKSLCEGDG